MSLSRTNVWIAGTVAVCLLLSAAAWFLLISPTRADAAQLREDTAATTANNQQLEQQIAVLKAQFATIDQKKAELAAIRVAMPADPELADLNRKLEAEAAAAGVVLMRVTPGAPVTVVAPAAAAPAAAETGEAVGTETADGTAAAAAAQPAASGVLAIPVVVEIVGPFGNASAYLEVLQDRLGRDFLVEGLTAAAETPAAATGAKPAVANGDVTMTITGKVFVLPETTTAPVTSVPETGTGTTDS